MSRYIAPAKKTIIDNNIDVVLLCAGAGRRIKSFGSKSLFPVRGTNLINYQIDTIKQNIPNAEIVVVLGYEIDKIYKYLPDYVRIVENERYETTSSTRSAFLGVRACSKDNILIINGDIFFNNKIFEICTSQSGILVDNNRMIGENKLGVIIEKDYVSCFNYDIATKWGQAIHLFGKDIAMFNKICLETKQEVIISEVIETMINRNVIFKAIEPKDIHLVEIDVYKDLERTK